MKRPTPDSLPDLPDAGCCTGMPPGTKVGGDEPSEAALKRGFSKVSGQSPHIPMTYHDDDYGGFLSRPHGWER